MGTGNSAAKDHSILLTGGSGFLGRAILNELLLESPPFGVKEVRVYDLHPVEGFNDSRLSYVEGDVRDVEKLKASCQGMDLVIHSGAIVDWGTYSDEEIYSVNVEGTRNVIEACRFNGVQALVFTASLDVLFNGQPLRNVSEETPYPESHSTSYCSSKYLAEKMVLKANSEKFKTCSLRPADIYGEGDPYHMGNLIAMAKGGFYVRLGNGKSRCQHVYVGNVAYAHVLAAASLLRGDIQVPGQAYFLTDQKPSNFFTFFDRFVEGSGYRIWPKNLWIPRGLAYTIGVLSESMAVLLRPIKKYRPKMSRFAVTYTSTDYTFTSEKAKKDFGFSPKYEQEEAYKRTVAYFKK